VGAVEIKVPGRSGVNNEIFAGQLYDYLRILRDIFGIDCPYGILSTYDEWRFCWLSRISKGRRNTAAEPRNLICSRVFKQDDKDLPKALVWTLNAMAESTAVNDTGVPTQGEYHLFMNSEEVQWSSTVPTGKIPSQPRRSEGFLSLRLLDRELRVPFGRDVTRKETPVQSRFSTRKLMMRPP